MGLKWEKSMVPGSPGEVAGDLDKYEVHVSESYSENERSIEADVIECLEYSIGLLYKNVRDESRFFLIEWSTHDSILTLVVTDDAKKIDSPIVVKCHFTRLADKLQPECFASASERDSLVKECAENIKFCCKEHLSTSSAFSQYSLIALFTSGERAQAGLV